MIDAKTLVGPKDTIISEIGSGYIDSAIGWDDFDRGFLILTHAPDLENNNITFGELYIAEDGDNFVHFESKRTDLKNDTVKMTNRKARLVITFTNHGTGVFPRPTKVEDWVHEGLWQEKGNAPRPCVPPANRRYYGVSEFVTRGQEAKIVSEAAGFNDDVSNRHTFEDVPPLSPFHPFVERLAMRGIVVGKPCG